MNEKRRFHRVKKSIPLKISHSDFDVVTETKDISGNGAYCAINKPIELMTKLDIILEIPKHKGGAHTAKKINCQGVVIRMAHDNADKTHPYHIGIFFNDIKESDRKILTEYLNSLAKNQPVISRASTPHLN